MSQGLFALVLHAHLPFVRHPEQEGFLEEHWFFEALTETYLPLLERLQRLIGEQIPVRLNMSLSPTLLAMLADPLLQTRYLRYLDRLIALSDKEVWRTRWQPLFHRMALRYQHRLTTARHLFDTVYSRNLIQAFRDLERAGVLELLGCCATHGYLPLMAHQPEAARAQILIGAQAFEQAFGHRPVGFWLPECGYAPGHDAFLKLCGVRYCITDSHGLLFGSPRPTYGVYAPVVCPSGVAAFGRDIESSEDVWSTDKGYPRNPDYREFYRDIGFDLEFDYLKGVLNGDGVRASTGFKYYRITGRTDQKQPYDPDRGAALATQHAEEFLAKRTQQVARLQARMDRQPIIVSPYDAELFGHWWFEGPEWLEAVIRGMSRDSSRLRLIRLSEYGERYPKHQAQQPCLSSWGDQGYNEVWLNGANDWVYRHLHTMADRMVEVARRSPRATGLHRRALNQLARELLLAQASDWTFILKAQTHTAYAYRRLHSHLGRFTRLYEAVTADRLEEPMLAELEATDNLFPFLDYRVYAAPNGG